ncbi:MAG: hypothetical protein RL088_4197 [Verrucomicrobiota bacterium]|jgi:hypothetical protein
MNSDKLQTAALVAAAMLLGGGAAFLMLEKRESKTSIPAPAKIAAEQTEPSAISRFTSSHDDELEAALADARSHRTAGTLKALATTADEFARALGEINFRLHDFSVRYEEVPDSSAPTFAAYSDELKSLTADLANLLSDDSLMEKMDADDPKSLAHHQSLMAAGALSLDTATAAKIEAIIFAAYEKSLPPEANGRELTAEEAAEFDAKFDALTDEIEKSIRPLLNAEQTARLDSMGPDQVLFGLEQE